jgi:hypothetical protein
VALARVSLAETLLADLRPDEARRALLPVKDGLPGDAASAARVRLLLGRSIELEGDREGALAHYRVAAAGADRDLRKSAQSALAHPIPAGEVQGRSLLAEARRARESGHTEEAADRYREAFAAWPRGREAALGVAEDEIRAGHAERGRALLPDVEPPLAGEPPWLRAWALLLAGRLRDLEGDREAAVLLYKKVLKSTYRRAELREGAEAGLRAPFRPEGTGGS